MPRSQIIVAVALFAALLVALLSQVPRLNGEKGMRPIDAAPSTAQPDVSPTPAARHTRRPSIQLAMPAPSVAPTTVPDACAEGTSGTDNWWTCLPPTPAWDAKRADYLRERLAKYLDLDIPADRIECRTRCCRVTLTSEQYHDKFEELSSSVGLRIGPTDGLLGNHSLSHPGMYEIRTCWRDGDIDDYPDRAIERDELLAAIQPELAACARGLAQPRTLDLMLWLGDNAELEHVVGRDSGEPWEMHDAAIADPVRDCVETVLRKAAAFEPAPDTMTRSIPLTIHLAP